MVQSTQKRKSTSSSYLPPQDDSADTPKWYSAYILSSAPSPPTKDEIEKYMVSKERKKAVRNYDSILGVTVNELQVAGVQALEAMNQKSLKDTVNKADQRWIDEMLQSGTISDKVSALTLQIKHNPTRCLQYLDSLLAIAHKKGRRETNTAIDALCDLFMNELLPKDRKLRSFVSQQWIAAYSYHTLHFEKSPIPNTHAFSDRPNDALLAYYALEDGIKSRYNQFYAILEEGVHDNFVHIKRARINNVYELLKSVPEKEDELLALIVNKLGDNERKIASKCQYLLNELLESNPGMKFTVVKEIERLLFRPNIRVRAQYYSLVFLNQMLFHANDYVLAQALIGLYLSLFRVTISNTIPSIDDKKVANSKFLSKNKKYLKDGVKVGRKKNLVKKVKKLADKQEKEQNDGLNKKILGALLTGISRALPYAQTVPDTPEGKESQRLLNDIMVEHTDVLFRLINAILDTDAQQVAVAIQALALLYQIIPLKEDIRNRFYVILYKSLLCNEIAHNSKLLIFMNILFKSMKYDKEINRVYAFVKRLLQVAPNQGVPFVCSVLFVCSEIAKSHDGLKTLLSTYETTSSVSKSVLRVSNEDEDSEKTDNSITVSSTSVSGQDVNIDVVERTVQYDLQEGDPLFAFANLTGLYEILPLIEHYHPSVAKFALLLAQGESISYNGNPMEDFTRMKFLDKFVNKKAKKDTKEKLSNMALRHRPNVKMALSGSGKHEDTVDIESFKRDMSSVKSDSSIAETDKFFYQYFKDRTARKPMVIGEFANENEDDFAERLMEAELLKINGISKDEIDEMDNFDADDFDMSSDSELEEIIKEGKRKNLISESASAPPSKKAKKADTITYTKKGAFDEEEGSDSEDLDMDVDEFEESDDDDNEDQSVGGIFGDTFASADEFAELLEAADGTESAIGDKHTELLEKFGYSKGRGAIKKGLKDVKKQSRK